MSNGGFMSIRLGCQSTALFAAVASVTGVLGNENPRTDEFICDLESSEGRAIPYLHLHGTADRVVPYYGRNLAGFKSVAATVSSFRELNHCEHGGAGNTTYRRGATTCISYCPVDTQNVTLCTIAEGGHIWFSDADSGVETTAAVVEFFLRHSR
jgi:poly(3-hydroxybutyrate) depolymerase